MESIVTARLRDALQWYASAIETEEGAPDHGYSILPVAEDLDNGMLEVHIVDKLARGGDAEAVFLLTLARI